MNAIFSVVLGVLCCLLVAGFVACVAGGAVLVWREVIRDRP